MSLDEGDQKLNLLVAYPYMTDKVIKILTSQKQIVRFVLDSGAFTAWKSGNPIKLDDYCRFIENLPFEPWRYFTLDVIGDPEGSMRNYEKMLSRGFKPVPIFTRGEDPSVLDDYYKTSDVVGIGGLVGTKGNKAFVNGIMKHVGKRKVHWLGFTAIDFIKYYKPYMCDSSTWLSALKFARILLYKEKGNFVKCCKKDFVKKPSNEIIKLLIEYNINPKEMKNSNNWKNTGKGESPTEKIAYKSFVKYQIDVQKNIGTKIFMAVASDLEAHFSIEAYNFWGQK